MKKVEQISSKGEVVMDYDVELSSTDMKKILSKHLTVLNDKKPYEVSIEGRRFFLCVKNISYLGHPHPIHKKRIQISGKWQSVLRQDNSFLIGMYSYDGRTLFTLFDTARYRRNKLNNSSAHIHTMDLLNAFRYGEFKKTDSRGNQILTFTEAHLLPVLTTLARGSDVLLTPELTVVDHFSRSVPSAWEGKYCYSEMIKARFPDALQAEWPGFYLEFRFSDFLKKEPTYQKICSYEKNKKIGTLDFDLNFNGSFLGDLKMHSVESGSILGNDFTSFEKALGQYKRLWYVVVNHKTVKDRDKNFIVTKYWNNALGMHRGSKKNALSYGSKMKHSVTLLDVLVIEVNFANRKYLSTFSQGLNSNGKPRATKIKINKKDIDNFLIYRRPIVN